MGREPGPRVTNLGAPYSATHTSPGAPAEPLLLAFPIPSPTPRALAETYRPGRCPSTGPALRASGPAPTWRRSGQADRWGWGADRALSGRGGQGEGLGEGETLSRLPLPPRGVRKRSRRGCRRVRVALLTTRRTWKAAAPENPRSLTVRPVPGTEARRHGLSKLSPPTPPPTRSRQPPPLSSDAARHRRRRDVSAHASRVESFPAGAPPTGVQLHLLRPPLPGGVPP